MASPTQWMWVGASSWSWWWTRKPGVLQSMASQSQDWATELNSCTYIYGHTYIYGLYFNLFKPLFIKKFFKLLWLMQCLYMFCHSGPQPFLCQGPVSWKGFPQTGMWGVVSGWFKDSTFIVYFISIIITSAPPQIIRH